MKRKCILIEARRWFFSAGYAALGYVALSGCVSAATGEAGVPNPYANLNCEQLQAEYDRLNRGILIDKPGAHMSGAAEGIAAATRSGGMPSAESTARGLDRSVDLADALRRLEHLSAIYRWKACTTKVESGDTAMFAPAADLSLGQREYKYRCAMCHGERGKGDGWFAKYLKDQTPSLTRLKQSHGEVFPFAQLYEVIDGRKEVAVHGGRGMPVWGDAYHRAGEKAYESYVGEPSPAEWNVRAKVLALLKYILQLQE